MKTVVAGALGECVHVAGVTNFLRLAEQAGWRTLFLGPAVPIDNFHIWRQTRTGLLSYPADPGSAHAHLAASVYLQMALRPHIAHVVGYSDGDHTATAADEIESCKLTRRSIENASGAPDMLQDNRVKTRVNELFNESSVTLEAVRSLAFGEVEDPLTDPATLTQAVISALLDAPQLKNNPYGRGQIITRKSINEEPA